MLVRFATVGFEAMKGRRLLFRGIAIDWQICCTRMKRLVAVQECPSAGSG
jgi:hypothetical protein